MPLHPFVAETLRPHFEGKKILLGISGSIAAFKSCDLIRLLKSLGAKVRVVPTENAFNFVTKITLETLSEEPVTASMWSEQGTHHISTARWADIAVIAPATANTIAKMAHGYCDDLLSTELLAFTGPVFVAPAMNPAMYAHAATQANVNLLRQRGVHFLGPVVGITSCKEEGAGRMLEPDDMLKQMSLSLASLASTLHQDRASRRVLITLGPTRSYIDPVRYITNRSSGLMGASLCWEAGLRGYPVTAVCGPISASAETLLPPGIEMISVTTADEMLSAAQSRWPSSHAFLSAAAVLDFDIAATASHKLKKTDTNLELKFRKAPDVLKTLSQTRRPGQWVLGFAAETNDIAKYAQTKLEHKECNFLFANDVSEEGAGFETLTNRGIWLERSPQGTIVTIDIASMTKPELASTIFDRMEAQWFLQKVDYASQNLV